MSSQEAMSEGERTLPMLWAAPVWEQGNRDQLPSYRSRTHGAGRRSSPEPPALGCALGLRPTQGIAVGRVQERVGPQLGCVRRAGQQLQQTRPKRVLRQMRNQTTPCNAPRGDSGRTPPRWVTDPACLMCPHRGRRLSWVEPLEGERLEDAQCPDLESHAPPAFIPLARLTGRAGELCFRERRPHWGNSTPTHTCCYYV